jgi:murein L,D-transpeptidase YafK
MASAALVALVTLSGCQTDGQLSGKHLKELSPQMLAELTKKNMPKDSAMLVRLFKEESELEVWKQDTSGRFALLKTYPICRWSGELGPKIKEGDRQAPEGFYTITPAQMNPNSSFHLSFNMGYPNAFDRAHGRTGAHLMVHGDCSSRGCYAMTNDQIEEIYALGRESFFGGQKAFQVQAYPFRMTAQNLARHRNNPHMAFWKMLKEGNDHFEVTGQEPKVDVCEKRYVFNADTQNATPIPGGRLNPTGRCPAIQADPDVVAKQRQDEVKIAELSSSVRAAPVRTGVDGGMHKSFLAKLQTKEVREPDGTVRYVVDATAASSLGSYVNPPAPAGETVTGTAVASAPSAPAATARPAAAQPSQSMALASSGSRPAEPRTSSSSYSRNESSALGRMTASVGRFFGGGGGEDAKPTPVPQQAAPVPTPRPAPKQAAPAQSTPPAGHGAIPHAPRPVQTAQPAQPPAAPPQQSAQAAPQPTAGMLPGAQPVVPSSSFSSRWGFN